MVLGALALGGAVEGVVEAADVVAVLCGEDRLNRMRGRCRKKREVRSSYAGLVAPDMASTTERGPLQEERSDCFRGGLGQD